VFVGDVAEAVVKAVGSPSGSGTVYELGGLGQPTDVGKKRAMIKTSGEVAE
jgi:nucleoside-diphosphate-sugar epimerase